MVRTSARWPPLVVEMMRKNQLLTLRPFRYSSERVVFRVVKGLEQWQHLIQN